MLYDLFALLFAFMALVFLGLVSKGLFKRGWVLGWLKGNAYILMILACCLLSLIAWDLFRYDVIKRGKSISTISFEELENQRYQATVVTSSGQETTYELRGDQWKLNARIVKWENPFRDWGFKNGYRLEKLSGRYYSLNMERTAQRTEYDLNPSFLGVDVWKWLNRNAEQMIYVKTFHGKVNFIPMSDGALYEVIMKGDRLQAQPLNERAQTAMKRWL